MKLMQHPEHGFHNAYNMLEVETLRKLGWTDHVPAPKPEPVKEEAIEAPAEEVRRGPGRPRKD